MSELSQILISLDFEVYKYDWLAGFKIYQTGEYIQIHNDVDALKQFITEYSDAIYFTINGYNYDDNILDGILNGKDPYSISKRIIVHKEKLVSWRLPIVAYDLQFTGKGKMESSMPSLKVFEANNGMSIEELPISSSYEDKLDSKQLEILKDYNRHDLDATELCMTQRFNESFMVKVNLISYFGLDFRKWIVRTPQAILCEGLGAVRGDFSHQSFTFGEQFTTLQLANERVRDWLIKEDFYEYPLEINICGIPHILAKGGIHGAKNSFYRAKNLWHIDFASFYPSLMLEYNLLSRALIGNGGREKFLKLRSDRLIYKKKKDPKDPALKIGLNSVFGAADNEFLPLYDPSRSRLVCMYGQAYTIDLLEKLEPYIDLVQSNTDGIIFELKVKDEWHEKKMRAIVAEFIERTGLNAEIDQLDFIAQRDVNNYMALEGSKEVLIGNTASSKLTPSNAYYKGNYRIFQTTIVERALAKYLLYKKPIEETVVEEFVDGNWFRFQAISKTGSQYHKVCTHEIDGSIKPHIEHVNMILKDPDVKKLLKEYAIKGVTSYNTFYKKYVMDELSDDALDLLGQLGVFVKDSEEIIQEVQHVNRVFASNDKETIRVLKKYKYVDGKESAGLVSGLPDNVFVFNKDLKDFDETWQSKIDLEWYINQAYRETYAFITGNRKEKNYEVMKHIVRQYELED